MRKSLFQSAYARDGLELQVTRLVSLLTGGHVVKFAFGKVKLEKGQPVLAVESPEFPNFEA